MEMCVLFEQGLGDGLLLFISLEDVKVLSHYWYGALLQLSLCLLTLFGMHPYLARSLSPWHIGSILKMAGFLSNGFLPCGLLPMTMRSMKPEVPQSQLCK